MGQQTEEPGFRLPVVRTALRRYAGPGVVGLFGIGQSVSGFQSPVIGYILMGVAVLWAAWYLWESLLRHKEPVVLPSAHSSQAESPFRRKAIEQIQAVERLHERPEDDSEGEGPTT